MARILIFSISIITAVIPVYGGQVLDVYNANKKYKAGKFDSAVKMYEEAIEKADNKPEIYYNLATSYVQQENYLKAEKNFQEALQLADEDEIKNIIFYNMGNMYFMSNNLAKAIASWKYALIHDPEDKDAKVNLEIALKMLKKQNPKTKEQDPEIERDMPNEDNPSLMYPDQGIEKTIDDIEQKTNIKRKFIVPNFKVDKDW